jgi:putative peptidoglycan lipid II flippase
LLKLVRTHRAEQITDGNPQVRAGLWNKFISTLGLDDPNTRRVLLLMGPRLLGVAVVQLNFWVNNNLASHMEAGSAAALAFGFSLMLMAQAVIAQSVSIAAMPTFSAQHALGKLDEMRVSLAASMRGILLLALPASIGLMILREPIVSVLYQRGEFDENDVQLVAWVLLWYAAGLVGHSVMEVLTRAFYAQHDTRTPVVIGTVAMGLNVLFSIWFSKLFAQIGLMPVGGLALANSLATALEAAALFIFMRKRLDGIEGKTILDGLWRISLGGLVMAISLIVWNQVMDGTNRWVAALGGVVLGGLIYFAVVTIVKVPEIKFVTDAVVNRLRR